jgi:hypothetical protein
MEIRRIYLCRDVVLAEGGLPAIKPVTRVAACAVIANPLAGQSRDDLSDLIPIGADLGEQLVKEALGALRAPAVSYGKAAIVGTSGDIEHAAAILHPRMGKPMRSAAARPSFPPTSRSARSARSSTYRWATRTTSGRSIKLTR